MAILFESLQPAATKPQPEERLITVACFAFQLMAQHCKDYLVLFSLPLLLPVLLFSISSNIQLEWLWRVMLGVWSLQICFQMNSQKTRILPCVNEYTRSPRGCWRHRHSYGH